MGKIMFVTASVSHGGAEKMLINIVNNVSRSNDVLLVNVCYGSRPFDLNNNVDYKCYNKKTSKAGFVNLFIDIRKFEPDYLFTTSNTIGYLLIFLKYVFLCSFKVYIRIAVPPSESVLHDLKSDMLRLINRLVYDKADLLISQTNFMKDDLINYYSLNGNNILVIRNIVNVENVNKFSLMSCATEFEKGCYNILSVGALYSVKGFDLLIESISILIKENPNIRLYIIGEERYEDGYRNKLEKLISDKRLNSIVKLLGYKENPYPYFRDADLFVMSSRHEGYPNVVLEALCLKTPVVTTDVVDFSDVINSCNGIIVSRGHARSLAEGIEKAIVTLKKPINNFNISNFDYNKLFLK